MVLLLLLLLGQLTAGEAEAGLVATDVLAAWWQLEERSHVDACHLVKIC